MQKIEKMCGVQRGSTLVISMIILAVIMLLGVTAMIASDTQYKLAGNLQFADLSLNNAESAATTAEVLLGTIGGATYATTFDTYGNGFYSSNSLNPLTMAWSSSNSVQVDTSKQYIIQRMSTNNKLLGSGQSSGQRASTGCNMVNTYLITARGTSGRGATKLVQSYYSVLAC